jgi:tyrosyl-tRNA synthetase
VLVDNADWLDNLEYLPFLREVGRHFSVNRMLTFDSVQLRLEREQSLSFLEFNYMIMQAYDFLELSRREGCRLQMGGSDQWGNIINGVELCRRADGTEVFAVTTPLITTADGAKMGKTAQGAVWLNAEGPDGYRLSAYDYWQFWRNTADADVTKFARLFTDLPLDEIARLEALQGAEINQAKIVLATEATALLHGREAADAAAATAAATFAAGGSGEALPSIETGGVIGLLAALVQLGFCASPTGADRPPDHARTGRGKAAPLRLVHPGGRRLGRAAAAHPASPWEQAPESARAQPAGTALRRSGGRQGFRPARAAADLLRRCGSRRWSRALGPVAHVRSR